MSKSSVRCGVLGLGKMGYRHAETLATRVPGALLAAVHDAIPERTAEVAARLGARGYGDWQEIVADPSIDAVIIVTPSSTHAEICIEAARAGKAIFCEKPLALTIPECEAVDQAVQATGALFQLGFMRRFDPGYAAAKRAVEQGAIGEVVAYNGISRDPAAPPPEYVAQSGGIYLDSLIHEFDIARFLMSDEVVRLHTTGKRLIHPWMAEYGDVDTAHVALEFSRGGLGHIEGYRTAVYGYDIRAEVLGTRGSIAIGYDRQTPITVKTAAGLTHDFVPDWLERFREAYMLEMVEFIRSVQAERRPIVGPRDGRQALLLALAAKRSQELGHPVDVEAVARGEV